MSRKPLRLLISDRPRSVLKDFVLAKVNVLNGCLPKGILAPIRNVRVTFLQGEIISLPGVLSLQLCGLGVCQTSDSFAARQGSTVMLHVGSRPKQNVSYLKSSAGGSLEQTMSMCWLI